MIHLTDAERTVGIGFAGILLFISFCVGAGIATVKVQDWWSRFEVWRLERNMKQNRRRYL